MSTGNLSPSALTRGNFFSPSDERERVEARSEKPREFEVMEFPIGPTSPFSTQMVEARRPSPDHHFLEVSPIRSLDPATSLLSGDVTKRRGFFVHKDYFSNNTEVGMKPDYLSSLGRNKKGEGDARYKVQANIFMPKYNRSTTQQRMYYGTGNRQALPPSVVGTARDVFNPNLTGPQTQTTPQSTVVPTAVPTPPPSGAVPPPPSPSPVIPVAPPPPPALPSGVRTDNNMTIIPAQPSPYEDDNMSL